jgi:hypothetical protein
VYYPLYDIIIIIIHIFYIALSFKNLIVTYKNEGIWQILGRLASTASEDKALRRYG